MNTQDNQNKCDCGGLNKETCICDKLNHDFSSPTWQEKERETIEEMFNTILYKEGERYFIGRHGDSECTKDVDLMKDIITSLIEHARKEENARVLAIAEFSKKSSVMNYSGEIHNKSYNQALSDFIAKAKIK